MKLETLNRYLMLAWVLVTIGTCVLNVGAGLISSGIMLAAITLYLSRVVGIFQEQKEAD